MLANYPDVLNVNHLCQILDLGRQSVYRLLQENKIFHIRIGAQYRIPKNSVIEYLTSQAK